MQNLPNARAQIKADRTPFLKFYTDDWLAGTIGLSFEEKGFYLEVLIRMWDRKDGLPDDDKWLAASLQCNPRTVRKIRASLMAAGKLRSVNGQLVNDRMMREICGHRGTHSSRIEPEFEPNSSPIRAELEPNAAKNPMISTHEPARTFHIPDTRSQKEIAAQQEDTPVQDAALPPKVDLKSLSEKLISACNGSLDNPVNCLGLLNLATPQMWIANGCDLEADIIPTLEAAGKRYHGKRIRDWAYFTGMVAEAKAKRTAKLPDVTAAPATGKARSKFDQMLDNALAGAA